MLTVGPRTAEAALCLASLEMIFSAISVISLRSKVAPIAVADCYESKSRYERHVSMKSRRSHGQTFGGCAHEEAVASESCRCDV